MTKFIESTKITGTLYGQDVRHFFWDLYRYRLGAKYTGDDPAETVLMPSDDLDLIYSEISSEESTLIETTLEDEEEEL